MWSSFLPVSLALIGAASGDVLPTTPSDAEFDFVVVGGGAAGLVLAKRLSPYFSVAVIEAGDYHPDEPLINLPGDFSQAQYNPEFDWSFVTEPQVNLTGNPRNGNVVPYSQGRMLGGSTGLNYLGWMRASKEEYDAWEALGNKGWNWDTLLPYFQKTETVHPPGPNDGYPGETLEQEQAAGPWGKSGPVQASYNSWQSTVIPPFVKALNALGIRTNPNSYGGNATGFVNAQSSIDPALGIRSYAANSYYTPQSVGTNLSIFTNTSATKVNFDNPEGSSKLVARSVQITNANHTYALTAKREVILSAGTFLSPKLLELSGIGGSDLLDSLGIQTLYNLTAVGENLQDHFLNAAEWALKPGYTTLDTFIHNVTFQAAEVAEYAQNHTGVLASCLGGLGYIQLDLMTSAVSNGSAVLQDVQSGAKALASVPHSCPLFQRQYEIQAGWLEAGAVGQIEYIALPLGGLTGAPVDNNTQYLDIFSVTAHPFARGTVHINSSDPTVAPRIDPRYLSEQVDQDMLSLGVAFAAQVLRTEPLGSTVARPNSPSQDLHTPAEWLPYIKTAAGGATLHHPIGTCAMAPEEWGGVVDTELRVYGTSNLRVIDGSVIPLHISAHPQQTIYAIAERASDLILAHNGAAGGKAL